MSTLNDIKEVLIEHVEIPTSHLGTWEKYPKHRWVYETSKLLDMQNIVWSPYNINPALASLDSFNYGKEVKVGDSLQALTTEDFVPGKVFVQDLTGERLTSLVAIFKGEIKWIGHKDDSNVVLESINGDIELRISALISLHFQKFSGVITIDTLGKDIISVNLYGNKGDYNMFVAKSPDLTKHIVRIYNNRPWGK